LSLAAGSLLPTLLAGHDFRDHVDLLSKSFEHVVHCDDSNELSIVSDNRHASDTMHAHPLQGQRGKGGLDLYVSSELY
jgi:hypothetical protein